MFRKSIFAALAVAAGVGATIAVKLLKDQNDEVEEDLDEEIHFITIEDDEEPAEEPAEEPVEEAVKFDASDAPVEVQEIAAVYPYLDPKFIEETLNQNASLNEAIAEDILVTITHSAKLTAEAKAMFVEIMESSGYETEEGEVVKASKKFFYQNGAVVSDVLNVANQTAALKGEYLGFETK